MCITLFTDLPDLVLLDILHYLSPFDAIQAFYDIENDNNRWINLLIECHYFSIIHQLRLPLFHFVCNSVIPRIGTKLSHLTLYNHQLNLARQKQILSYLTNLSSLHLIAILDLNEYDNDLSYFLPKNLSNLTIEFLNEHHIDAQVYIFEQIIFNKNCENLLICHLLNPYGLQLKHLNLVSNNSIQNLTIQLKDLTDLHILFDYLSNIRILNIEICQWKIEDIKYDYKNLSKKLPNLIEFSLQTDHILSFNRLLLIIENLIFLENFSFIYRNYDEYGIDINRLELCLNHLIYLKQLKFLIQFIYFHFKFQYTFENNLYFKDKWNIQTINKLQTKTYLAFTRPLIQSKFSISTDLLLLDNQDLSTITNLILTLHMKYLSFQSIIQSLNIKFSCLTSLHLIDLFEIEDENQSNFKLVKLHSFNAIEMKNSKTFTKFFLSMPNLNELHIQLNLLIKCDLKSLLFNNKIKQLQLDTNDFDKIEKILIYFSNLEHLIINTKNQSNQIERKIYQIVYPWFDICSRLYTIHIKAHKLTDLFYFTPLESNETVHVQYSNEMLTVWK